MSLPLEKQLQVAICQDLSSVGWIWTAPANLATAVNYQGQLTPTDNKLYNKEFALIPNDLFEYLESTQKKDYIKFFPESLSDGELKKAKKDFLRALGRQLDKPYNRGGGLINVSKQGFSYSVKGTRATFKLVEFAPASGNNAVINARYENNIFRVVHELEYSEHKNDRIDLAFFVNGLPVYTSELKNGMTETYGHAINQYKRDRTPWAEKGNKAKVAKKTEPLLNGSRAIAHFALDPSEVHVTTKLDGKDTYFSPFNAGGDSENPEKNKLNGGYSTSYFWKDFLQPHAFLNTLNSFVSQRVDERSKKSQTIFPRYHQWFGDSLAIAVTLQEGVGHNSLMHWSAGSGKSHGISFLAHYLKELHYENIPYKYENLPPSLKDEVDKFAPKKLHSYSKGKVFTGGGFIVTDRTNLDAQLSETVSQKDSVSGTVVHIDGKKTTRNSQGKDSKSKAAHLSFAINQAGSPIFLCTLQSFPHALEEIREQQALADKQNKDEKKLAKTFFVIRDEAHTAEGGKNTQKLKELLNSSTYASVLSDAEKKEFDEQIENEELSQDELEEILIEKTLIQQQKSHSDNSRISYYAFTATPRATTLKLYGRPNPLVCAIDGSDNFIPLNTYSMKQAINEGYILDVTQNYTTFDIAFKLAQKDTENDQLVDAKKGRKEILSWAKCQPEVAGGKAKIIVEHFSELVFDSLNRVNDKEQAQAMVFANSRDNALLYKKQLDEEIRQQGLTLKTLVAFSGTVTDPDTDEEINEWQANGFTNRKDIALAFESGTPDKKNEPYHILIVANKYQTGYDNPRLVAAYIDKSLKDIEAVQAISRLNRVAPSLNKKQVYVLDFANDYNDIIAAFSQYYGTLSLEDKTDDNSLNRILSEIESRELYTQEDVIAWSQAFFAKKGVEEQGVLLKLKGHFNTLRDRALTYNDTDKVRWLDDFRLLLKKYVEVYSFQSLMHDYRDSELERLSLFFGRLYSALLPTYTAEVTDGSIDLDTLGIVSTVIKSKQHPAGLHKPIKTITLASSERVASSQYEEDEIVHLRFLIDYLNEIFDGLEGVTEANTRALADQIVNMTLENKEFGVKARTNSLEAILSSPNSEQLFKNVLIGLHQANEAMVENIYSDNAILRSLQEKLLRVAYDKANEGS